jgi:pyridoxal phosphate enzyme (YggS family)
VERIQERIAAAERRAGVVAGGVCLVAVTKYSRIDRLRELFDLGLRHFGESRSAQLTARATALPDDIAWHLIGHLQSNKINRLLPHVSLIQSLDSIDLAKGISQRAGLLQRQIPVLLEVKTTDQGSKTGCPMTTAEEVYEEIVTCPQLSVRGLMTMAPHGTDETAVRRSFKELRRLFDELSSRAQPPEVLSMGMSQDFEWAIEEGANMVRVGRALVGD